jgi:lysophospholipase L1-like esterase
LVVLRDGGSCDGFVEDLLHELAANVESLLGGVSRRVIFIYLGG